MYVRSFLKIPKTYEVFVLLSQLSSGRKLYFDVSFIVYRRDGFSFLLVLIALPFVGNERVVDVRNEAWAGVECGISARLNRIQNKPIGRYIYTALLCPPAGCWGAL